MLDLETRKRERIKQRELEKRQAEDNGTSVESEEFDAHDWVNDSVDGIKAAIGELTEEQLNLIEQAEASGKDRVGVKDAIKEERTKRTNSQSNWGS